MLPRSLSADSAGIRSHPIYLPVLRAPPPPLDPLVVFGGVEGCLLITSESPLTRHKLGGDKASTFGRESSAVCHLSFS